MDQDQKTTSRYGIAVPDAYNILMTHGDCALHSLNCQLPEGMMLSGNGNGFSLLITADAKLSKPVQIINLLDDNSDAPLQTCNRIVMEAGSSADLLIGDYTLSGKPHSYRDETDITLGEATTLNMVRLQTVNDSTSVITATSVRQAASSQMRTHFVNLSGGSICNHLTVKLSGKNAGHFASGLSLTQQNEHTENNILIEHASPDCQSRQLFKQILSDRSTGIFTGRTLVNKDSQHTLAYQRSSNILLHPEAKMDIRPQLEIYADDVKCSHGATIGQLDAEALFYLRSRGVGENEAKKMLLQAFAGEILDGISCIPFREGILKLMDDSEENSSNHP